MSPLLAIFLLGASLLSCMDLVFAETDPDWMAEALERHNLYRRGFNASPLVLNHDLCNASQSWANKLAEIGGDVSHSPDTSYGENVFALSGDDIQVFGTTPVDAWYDEIKHFDLNGLEPVSDVGVGSFTQMVWKSTREMCISYATSQNPGDSHGINVYVVAVYFPPGNDKNLEDEITPLLDSVVFYKDSSLAPNPTHLSDPVGEDEHLKSKLAKEPLPPLQPILAPHLPTSTTETPTTETSTTESPKEPEPEEKPDLERVLLHVEATFENVAPKAITFKPVKHEHKVDLCPKRNDEAELTTHGNWILSALKRANEYRHKHRAQPLMLDDKLCNISQAWSNELAKRDMLQSSRSGCGENLYVYEEGKVLEPYDPIDAWYKEIDNYDFKHAVSKQGDPVANFTQLLWKDSSSMCITMATTKENTRTYVVATFYPEGNVGRKYPHNVEREYSTAGMLKGLTLTVTAWIAFFVMQLH